jgi:hypothetical protein
VLAITFSPFWCVYPESPIPSPLFWPPCWSRRHATVAVRQQLDRVSPGPLTLIVDSSGLKVCGQGEWHSQKHGEKKCKRWKKLHIGMDDEGRIIASTVTESNERDPSQVPSLLKPVDRRIHRFIGDGIFDQEPVYTAVERHSSGARVITRLARMRC